MRVQGVVFGFGVDYTLVMATMIRTVSGLLLGLFLLGSSVAHAGSPLEGRWDTPKKEGTVEVTIQDGVLTGKLVESSHRKAKLGTVILRGFVRDGDKWVGKIHASKRNKTFDAELTLHGDKLSIEVSSGLVNKSVTWTRAD